MKSIIVTLIVALLVSTAFAEGTQNIDTEVLTRHVASEVDAVMIECPGDLEPAPGCYTIFGTTDLHRMVLDNLIRGYNDVNWVTPWERDRSVVSRTVLFDNGDVFTFFLIELEDFETTVFVQWILTVE